MRTTLLFALLVLAAFADPADAQASLIQRLRELHFPEVAVIVAPKLVEVVAEDATLSGGTASDLRRCIDDTECPEKLLADRSRGDGDGTVEAKEVADYEDSLRFVANLAGANLWDYFDVVRRLVSIDGHPPKSVKVTVLELEGAEGDVTSTSPIGVSLRLEADFSLVESADRHEIRFARNVLNLTLTDRIVVRPGAGWEIPGDSIEPEAMRRLYAGGRISGSQREVGGVEPLTFEIEERSGLPAWGWALLLLVVAGAGGAGYWWWRTQRRKA